MIKLQHVNKYFNKRKANEIHVINDTSLELPENGVVALLGPSGCGKTTLLNAIGGLDKVNSGQIFIDDANISKMRPAKVDALRNAKIGYIFQNFNLLDRMTVFENVAIALRMIGIKDKQVIKERVNYCLKSVGIYQFRNKTTDALSGGQRQRVAIARAIVKNPRIIIADEPTGNLDSANTIEVMNIIKTISKDILVLLVTHEKKIAEFYSSRIIDMRDGRITGDRNNDTENFLDYQLENRIYLKDMPKHDAYTNQDVQLDVYSDGLSEADIKIVLRAGNLYIDTGGRYNVVDENGNIELIDEHYSAMDSSIYEKNSFEYDKYLPAGYEARYTSLYTPFRMFANGFRTIARFNKLKKLLLIGFVFASIFTFVSISNVFGVLNIKEQDFLTTNSNYVTVNNTKKDPALLGKLRGVSGAYAAFSGDTQAKLVMPYTEYLQSSDYELKFNASVTPVGTLKQSDLVSGKLPSDEQGVVIDRMLTRKLFKSRTVQQVGIIKEKDFIGRKLKVKNLGEFTITGISNVNSPSAFFADKLCQDVLMYSANGSTLEGPESLPADPDGNDSSDGDGGNQNSANPIIDYAYAPASTKIKKGNAPANDYEAVVRDTHEEEMPLGKEIATKVNGHKLKVVGYYTTDFQDDDAVFTTNNTLLLNYISKQRSVSVYSHDPDALVMKLQAAGYSAQNNYDRDRENYIKSETKNFRKTMTAAGLMILIALIEMYLMLRSSFLSRIKEVGTMRAIGLKKRDVYRMFMGEIIVITLITAIPGIAAAYYVLGNTTEIFGSKFLIAPWVALLTFALLLIFNLVAGLIPVIRTMRKTPAAILARTDI